MINKNDIKIILPDRAFKFRVAGIFESDGKILVTKMRKNNFYCFPGGHVEVLEDTKTAAERELSEELFFKFKLKKLLYIHENFFSVKDKNFHELCFYFSGKCKDNNIKKEDLIWEEIDNGEKLYHNFKWIDLKDVNKYDIRPKEILEYYLKSKTKFKHFCTNEITKQPK